jgi:hypothetical protein
LETKAGIEGLAFLPKVLERKVSSEPHDFTGKDMKVYIGKKGRYLGLPFLFGGQGKV